MSKEWTAILYVDAPAPDTSYEGMEVAVITRPTDRIAYLIPWGMAADYADARRARIFRAEMDLFVRFNPSGERIPVVVHRLEDVYARTPFKPRHRETLWRQRAALIGLGSVGSRMCDSFGRSGVGSFLLADPDILAIHNVGRHIGTLFDVGRRKTSICKEHLRHIHPGIRVDCFAEDVFEWDDEKLDGVFREVSVIVASTDQRTVQFAAAEVAHRLNVPAVFAGCYEEARGGEVFTMLPNEDAPCYVCLRGGQSAPSQRRTLDYSTAEHAEDYTAEPGLDAAVEQIAAIATQVTLSVLLHDEPDSEVGSVISRDRQFLLVGTARSENFYRFRKPFDVFFQPLSGRRRDCIVCGDHMKYREEGDGNGGAQCSSPLS